jgi:hypothetical protein
MPARPRIPLGSPLQLMLLGCSFALAAYAGVRLLADDWVGVALWIVGAALLHDLVLLPLYVAADRAVGGALGTAGRPGGGDIVRGPAGAAAGSGGTSSASRRRCRGCSCWSGSR